MRQKKNKHRRKARPLGRGDLKYEALLGPDPYVTFADVDYVISAVGLPFPTGPASISEHWDALDELSSSSHKDTVSAKTDRKEALHERLDRAVRHWVWEESLMTLPRAAELSSKLVRAETLVWSILRILDPGGNKEWDQALYDELRSRVRIVSRSDDVQLSGAGDDDLLEAMRLQGLARASRTDEAITRLDQLLPQLYDLLRLLLVKPQGQQLLPHCAPRRAAGKTALDHLLKDVAQIWQDIWGGGKFTVNTMTNKTEPTPFIHFVWAVMDLNPSKPRLSAEAIRMRFREMA